MSAIAPASGSCGKRRLVRGAGRISARAKTCTAAVVAAWVGAASTLAAGACATPRRSHTQPRRRCGYATRRTNRGRSRSSRSSGGRHRARRRPEARTGNTRGRLVCGRGGCLRRHPGRGGKPHPTEGRNGRAIPASTGRRRALAPTSRRAQAAATKREHRMGTRGDGRAREHTLRALARTPHAAYHRGFCARRRQIRLHSARSTLSRRRIGVGAEMGAEPPKCARAGAASPRPPSPSPSRPGAHLAACPRSPTQTRTHKPERFGQRTRARPEERGRHPRGLQQTSQRVLRRIPRCHLRNNPTRLPTRAHVTRPTRDRMSQPHRPIEAELELQLRFFERANRSILGADIRLPSLKHPPQSGEVAAGLVLAGLRHARRVWPGADAGGAAGAEAQPAWRASRAGARP